MSGLIFNSVLTDEIKIFIQLKRVNGYDYHSPGKCLMRFDKFLTKKNYQAHYLSTEIMGAFISDLNYLHPRGRQNYYATIRVFSVWLNLRRPESSVLEKKTQEKGLSRQAFIYSSEQIRIFLQKTRDFVPKTEIIPKMYYTLFCLLYTTGIRINEALSLDCDDYKTDGQLLHIKKGKFGKERYVVLSDSMNILLRNYLENRLAIKSIEQTEPMFLGKIKRRLIYNCVHIRFKRIHKQISIPHLDGIKPRIHDFRHTFAVHCLTKWYEQGGNVYNRLPFLSTYMGHVHISSTQVYLQFTEQLQKLGTQNFHQFFYNHSIEE